MRLFTICALFIVLVFSSVAFAESMDINSGNGFGGLVTTEGGSKVNWGNGLVAATSEVLPMQDSLDPVRTRALAVRQGGVESRKMLLDSVLSLRLTDDVSVASNFKDDLKTMNSLRGFVQNSLLATALVDSGAVEVTASLNLHDGLSSIIIPPTIPFLSGIPPTISGKHSDSSDVAGTENIEVYEDKAAISSGVIIDARGLEISPVLLPIIYDGKGVGVYGPFAVSRDSTLKYGMVSYVTDISTEAVRSRVGNFPLIVKPVNTQGSNKSNLILSLVDGSKMRGVLKRKSVSEKCAVVVLVDSPLINAGMQEQVAPDDALKAGAENEILEDSLGEKKVVSDQQ
ncbi:hypothetical protein [Maridesulfovibrio zosterae]|uniref:hypothetical protein n=1 Tax=Maridesulfovibrio zosterae TaxID=82171 RepID=UPI00042912BE|nr:hypothetical protein [Maridesulfovibrio zosterae]